MGFSDRSEKSSIIYLIKIISIYPPLRESVNMHINSQDRRSVNNYLLIYSGFHNGPVIGTKQQITDRAIALCCAVPITGTL